MKEPASQEDLLTPTVRDRQESQKPWSLRSEFYVAFFGGIPGITFFAFLNGRRLRLSRELQRRMLFSAVIAFLAAVAITFGVLYWLATTTTDIRSQTRLMRLVPRGVALVYYYYLRRLQLPAYRVYQFTRGGSYASPWAMGLLSILIGGTLQGLVLLVLVELVQGV